MRWAGHIACIGQMRNANNIFVGKPERKRSVGRGGVDGRIILNWIFDDRVERCGLEASGTEYGPVAGSCEHGDKPSGSI